MTDLAAVPALELKELTYRYGKNTALDDVRLQLPAGHIYGLLGRNGAGKTTLLNVLSATLFPQKGEALIFGHKAFERVETLKRLCVVREKTAYPKNLRVQDALFACAGLYPNWDQNYAEELLDRFELPPKKRFRQLSRGMESALGLVIGLAAGAIGVLVAWICTIPASAIVYRLAGIERIAQLPALGAALLVGVSMLMTLVAGLIPARFASRRDPVVALRTE